MVYLRYLIMANKPRIRFRGFTEDWEQRKLGDLYKRVNERNDGTLGRDKWISVAKMYFQDPDKVQSNNLDTRTYVMKKGDIAFEGHPNNEFKFGRFVLNDIGTGIISELFPIYRPITEYDLDFWKYAIQLERVMAPILAKSITSSGNSSNKLDHNHFLNKELLVPNIEEQKKIGTLLSLLSKNITLHQCKLKKLNLAKKSLLQKLFPRNGSQIPGVRFKGFTDAWEQRKLGDLYKRVNERNDGTLGRDKWISVAKMYFQDPDKVQSNNLDTRTYVMKKGDIAFEGHPNNEFKFGRFVLNDIGTGIISELFPIYRPITEYDLDFWKYAIQLERVMAPILAKSITSSGNSSNKLDHNHFLNKELLVPNIEEQKKIGTLLSLLSKNITLHQRKLERLQEVKKGLLQKMFV